MGTSGADIREKKPNSLADKFSTVPTPMDPIAQLATFFLFPLLVDIFGCLFLSTLSKATRVERMINQRDKDSNDMLFSSYFLLFFLGGGMFNSHTIISTILLLQQQLKS